MYNKLVTFLGELTPLSFDLFKSFENCGEDIEFIKATVLCSTTKEEH